jgi:hypothetical protein
MDEKSQLPSTLISDNQDCLFGKGWGYPQLVLRDDGKIYLSIANSPSNFSVIGTNNLISLNQWYNIVCTYKGSIFKIYINGILSNSQIISPPPSFYSYCNSDYFIGGFRHLNSCMPNDSVQFFNGILDDIGIWNRALTQQEITDLYNGNICYQTVSVTDTLFINTNITGFNPITYENTIRIWPNPTSDHITIDAGNLNVMNGYSVRIINSLGQQMFQTTISQQQYYLDLSTWTGNGMYFVHILDPNGNIIDIKKIVLR